MSHFTVLVIGDNIEEQLAPFQENNMEDCPQEYMKFEDEEDDYLKQYREGSIEMLKMASGELAYSWDDRFQVGTIFDRKRVIPADAVPVQVKHVDRFPTFEAFMEDYAGYKARDPKMNRYGRWENPNAKWDYYTAGGRWSGMMHIKQDRISSYGKAKVDQARRRDIDFLSIRNEAEAKARHLFYLYELVVAGRTVPVWAEVRERHRKDKIDEARKEYHADPVIQAINKHDELAHALIMEDPHDYFKGGDLDKFIAHRRRQAFCPHSILRDGTWYERGKMGWFAFLHDDKGADQWATEVEKMLDGLPEDALLTMVDCHI